MDWHFVLEWFGISVPAYSVLLLLSFLGDGTYKRFKFLLTPLSLVLFLISLPCFFTVGAVGHKILNRTYDRHISDMKKAVRIAEYTKRPPDREISLFQFDVSMYTDEYGAFDLYGWKKHELQKLGL